MKRKQLILLIFLTVLWLHPLRAQDLSGVKAQLNAMFSGLDKTKVPTGYLWDTAVNLVEGEDYDGSALTDSNYVDLPRLYDMITSLNSASVGADTIPANRAIARIQNASSGQNTVIGVLFQPYNFIVANALQDNLITYSNQVVSDKYINGIWQNPYGEAVLVGHAVGNEGVVYQSTSFTLQNVDSLSTQTFSSIQFDAGDGSGYHNVSFGSSFSVCYSSGGYKETKLKLVTGGITYLSHSIVNVVSPPNNAPSVSPNYQVDSVSVEYNGKIYYAKYSCIDSLMLNNPLIVAEGFDPWRIGGYNSIHRYSGFNDITDIKPFFGGFDVVYIDWYDCGADIRANAKLLEEVIKWVNSKKTSSNPNVVLGQSMGGLIARYCLCHMESSNPPVQHNTRLFISHDAPHHGVNVSPGLQYLYWDLRNLVNEDNEFWLSITSALTGYYGLFSTFLEVGSYTSVRQMLPVFLNSSEVYDNSVYLNFQTELNNMGFPKGDPGKPIENVAIVNGGGSAPGGVFSFYNPGDKLFLFYLQASSRFLVEAILAGVLNNMGLIWIPGRSTVTFSYDVFPYRQNSTVARSMSLTYTKTLFWRLPLTFVLSQKTGNNPGSGVPFDAVSSSYYSPPGDVENYYNWSLGFPWNRLVGTFEYEMTFTDKLQFVPTASALCYSGLYNQDFYRTSLSPGIDIPFDSYILNDTSSYHTSFVLDGMNIWLPEVLSEANVPPVVFDGDTLKIKGQSSHFAWATSNNSVATLTDSIVHRVSDGLVEFTASVSRPGQRITKTRKAIVGYPAVALSYQATSAYEAIVRASSSNTEINDLISAAVGQGALQYKWGVKIGSSPTVWREVGTACDTIHVRVPSPYDYVTVYMKWQHGESCDSTSREIQVYRSNTYYSNIDHLEVDSLTDVLSIQENPMHSFPSIVSTYGHYCMTFSAVPSNSLPAITSITIDNTTFPVSGVHYLSGYGSTAVVYVFDILNSQLFQDLIFLSPQYIRLGFKNLNVSLNGTNGSIQTLNFTCTKILYKI